MSLSADQIKNIIEAALMAAGQPLSIDRILSLFLDEYQPTRDEIRQALSTLAEECENRGVELKEVSSGFRFQAKQDYAQWVARLWEEKPAKYSRALLETLALIAYRQPITRGEIEDIRGVSVSSNIMKTLQEREWVKVVGHRDVPGKPAMYATTKQFLDYFGLKGLTDLPTLAEIRDIDSINAELDLAEPGAGEAEGGEGGVAEETSADVQMLEGEAPEDEQAADQTEETDDQAEESATQENTEQAMETADSEPETVEASQDEEEDSTTTSIVDSA
jgi:segregation and condensation protein B